MWTPNIPLMAQVTGANNASPVSIHCWMLAVYSAVNSLRSFANASRISGSGSANRGSSSRLGAVVLDNCPKRLRHTAAAPENQPPVLRIWRCLSRQIGATSSLSSAAKPVGS